ncbi:MAG: IclR family transcriptional regulator, partial [Bacillota bacterium]|nr:IclR family transcriptional regulator [Bacillota bacterium]
GLPLTTAARLAATLEGMGFLEREAGERGRYRLGMQLYYLGKVVESGMELPKLAGPILERLAAESRESAELFVRDGEWRVCVLQVEGPQTIGRFIRLGERLPLWAGSAGAVFLAYADPGELPALLARAQPLTPYTLTDPARWKARLEAVRREGYALSVSERELGAASIAAPVFDGAGRLRAALAISGPAPRFEGPGVSAQVERVRRAAEALSRLLGWRPEEALGSAGS